MSEINDHRVMPHTHLPVVGGSAMAYLGKTSVLCSVRVDPCLEEVKLDASSKRTGDLIYKLRRCSCWEAGYYQLCMHRVGFDKQATI